MSKGKWLTDSELMILRKMYEKHGADISKWEFELDRSLNAIRVQARRMGLCRVKSHTGMPTSQRKRLRSGFGVLCGQLHCNEKTALIELNRMRERGEI